MRGEFFTYIWNCPAETTFAPAAEKKQTVSTIIVSRRSKTNHWDKKRFSTSGNAAMPVSPVGKDSLRKTIFYPDTIG